MKIYIRAANISDIQAKIAKKQAEIDKKYALIAKREATIEKKLNLLKDKIDSDDYNAIVNYLELAKDSNSVPNEPNTWAMVRKYGFSFDDKWGKALYNITDDAESIYNTKRAIKEMQPTMDKYKAQLDAILQKEKQVDEIPEILKDFMNQLIDEWDRFDKNIRDNSREFYNELKAKMDELVPDTYSKEGVEKLLELYPRYQRWWEDKDRRFTIKFSMRDDFKQDYLEKPFKKKFGVSTNYAMDLWYMTDEQIHKANVEEGKRVILDLVKRVTKITGPILDWSGLHATTGNGGWTVLNGVVIGEDGKAQVDTILAGGYAVQRLHARTLVKELH